MPPKESNVNQSNYMQKMINFIVIPILISTICYLILKNNSIQNNNLGPADPTSLIPIGELINGTLSGAGLFNRLLDHYDSPYFKHIDFYTKKSSNSLILFEKFKTYQQTTFYTCGCCCALMVLNHLGDTKQNEKSIYLKMKEIQPNYDAFGATTKTIETFFQHLGYKTETKKDVNETNGPIEMNGPVINPDRFRDYILDSIRNNQYIICISPILGGHWTVIIGLDTMGTETSYDDVIIMADPFDLGDHRQDGYTIYNLHSFLRMWRCILPDHYNDGPFNFVKVWKE